MSRRKNDDAVKRWAPFSPIRPCSMDPSSSARVYSDPPGDREKGQETIPEII